MSRNAGSVDRAATKDGVLQAYFDLIVDQAPVPVYVVDADFKITRVNRRWLEMLGYESSEVVGRPSTSFLSSESRRRAVRDLLPLFRRVGSSRSVGVSFETKEGRLVPVLLDAEVCAIDTEHCHAFAVMRDPDDPVQYEGASATIEALHGIAVIQSETTSSPLAGDSLSDAKEEGTAGPSAGRPGAMRRGSRGAPHRLTVREQEVLVGLASGARNKEIAGELGTSVRTTKFHVENIYQKLHVHTRAQATRVAIELGMVHAA